MQRVQTPVLQVHLLVLGGARLGPGRRDLPVRRVRTAHARGQQGARMLRELSIRNFPSPGPTMCSTLNRR